jgi:glycosyltransferase involved in cell wall biosynthesis
MRPEEVAGETRPAKALASIAAGCPIIFAGVGTFCAEVVDHGLGLAPDWSAEVVAEAMADLLETARVDPAAYSRMRQVCSTYAAQHLDIRVSARQLVEGILEVANA